MSDYQSMVAEARRLSARSEEAQWRLAEITHEALASGTSAQQWATDIGLSVGRVSNYLKVWDRYSDPASRNTDWTFNDHSEVARLADDKAKTIIAKAERENISIGIARKRISMEDKHRAKFEAERQSDLDAALADTGNAVEAHQEVVVEAQRDLIDRRAYDGAREATKPLLATAAQVRVMGAPRAAIDLLDTINSANENGVAVPEPQSILDALLAAVEAVTFNAALHGAEVSAQ